MRFIQGSLFGKTSQELCLQTTGWILRPCCNSSQVVKFQCLIVGDGQTLEWCEADAVISPGASWMPNIGESPNVVVESSLSRILEDNALPKYYLSPRATIGILRRASRRGKSLPIALNDALLFQSLGGLDGRDKIRNAIEILRVLQQAISTQEIINWLLGGSFLFQQSQILQLEMYGESEHAKQIRVTAKQPESIVAKSAEAGRTIEVRRLPDADQNRCTSYRQQPIEQLKAEFDQIMQGMPHKEAQADYLLYCLREATKGTALVQPTLPPMVASGTQGQETAKRAAGFNGWRSVTGSIEYQEECAPCIQSTMPPNAIVHVCKTNQTGSNGLGICENTAYTLEACGVGQAILNTKNLYGNHPADSRVTGPLNICPTVTQRWGTGGGNTPLVAFSRQGVTVRRLTPMECERLQGFPDNWTAFGVDAEKYRASLKRGMKRTGLPEKTLLTKISDSKRYAAIGNSVAIPCVDYVLQGIVEVQNNTF